MRLPALIATGASSSSMAFSSRRSSLTTSTSQDDRKRCITKLSFSDPEVICYVTDGTLRPRHSRSRTSPARPKSFVHPSKISHSVTQALARALYHEFEVYGSHTAVWPIAWTRGSCFIFTPPPLAFIVKKMIASATSPSGRSPGPKALHFFATSGTTRSTSARHLQTMRGEAMPMTLPSHFLLQTSCSVTIYYCSMNLRKIIR